MASFRLVRRNVTQHPLRSLLTVGSLVVAIFLLCMLRSLIVALNSGVQDAQSNRYWVQSAVSLFVNMPISYQQKIEGVEGVEETCKWQWFGGYYQDPGNFFAQFACDGAELLEIYPEIDIVEGDGQKFLDRRNGCIIGKSLSQQFGWEVGDTVPLIGGIFRHPDGDDVAWEFVVEGVYEPRSSAIDNRTLFFNWEYFQETLESGPNSFTPGVGTIVLRLENGASSTAIANEIEEMYVNGPQRVQVTTEAEFQAQFVSMVGSVPFFISSIGGGVLIAILLACVNTMMMAAREQTHDIGVLKAMGFTDSSLFRLLLSQSLLMCVLGGVLGVALAIATGPAIADLIGTMFPNYKVTPETIGFGLAVAIGIGLLAGVMPAIGASRMKCVEALRAMG